MTDLVARIAPACHALLSRSRSSMQTAGRLSINSLQGNAFNGSDSIVFASRLKGSYHSLGRQALTEFIESIWNFFVAIESTAWLAFFALATAVLTGFHQRTHNRLSVRPLPDNITVFNSDEFSVHIENVGTGPLIIKQLHLLDSEGIEIESGGISKSFALENGSCLQFDWFSIMKNSGTIIAPGKSLTLLKILFSAGQAESAKENFSKNVNNKIRIKYTDLYNKSFTSELLILDHEQYDRIEPISA